MPLAYSAPTTLPALVPATTSGWMPLASSILITPIWANPFAAPPPRARPIFSFAGSGATTGVTGGGVGLLPPKQALSASVASSGSSWRRKDIGRIARIVVVG